MTSADTAYFDEQIRPLLDNPQVEFIGEIGEDEKAGFLGGARALLFPIDWPEPFGLVMIEAMACGTPVIGWRCGSVPEIVDEGLSGFVVETIEAAATAVTRAGELDPVRIRKTFERRFSVERMADCYLELYQSAVNRVQLSPPAAVLESTRLRGQQGTFGCRGSGTGGPDRHHRSHR